MTIKFSENGIDLPLDFVNDIRSLCYDVCFDSIYIYGDDISKDLEVEAKNVFSLETEKDFQLCVHKSKFSTGGLNFIESL
jgi:hypothetical protein